jgi:hypothetical protein
VAVSVNPNLYFAQMVGSSHGIHNELTRKKLLAEEEKKDL